MKSRTDRRNIVRFCLLWTLFIAASSAIASPKTLPRLPIWPTFDYGLGESIGKREIQKQGPTDELFLWRADGEYSTVYLMGSIHLLKNSSYPLASMYEYVYDQCDQLVVEHYEPDEEQNARNILSKVVLSDNKTLSQYVSNGPYKWIRNFAVDNGLPANVFDGYIPEYVYINILYMTAENYGFNQSIGVDYHFMDKAEAESKMIYSLEGAERYDKIFSTSMSEQAKNLESFISEIKKGNVERSLNELVDAWVNNKHDELETVFLENKKDNPIDYNSSIRDRNIAWIPKIKQYLKQKKVTLVIAGAFHFFGEHSVLKLLEDKGYKVNQLYDVKIPEILFSEAIKSDNLSAVKTYIQIHPNLNRYYYDDTTSENTAYFPLHTAVENNKLEIVKLLVNAGANIDLLNNADETALDIAIRKNHTEIQKLLEDQMFKISAFKYSGQFKFDINGMKGATFLIEASADLKLWAPIGEVQGTGSSVEFTDWREAIFEKQYYRLKLVE